MSGSRPSPGSAIAFAADTVKAKTLADDLDKHFPEDTLVQFNYLPSINAKLGLSRKDAAKAIENDSKKFW